MSYKVLLYDKNQYSSDFCQLHFEDVKIEQADMFRKDVPYRILQILRNFSCFSCRFALDDWYTKREEYDCFIVPDASFNKKILKIMSTFNQSKPVILYYRNRIRERDVSNIRYAKMHGFLVVTYSKLDAEMYDLSFVPQFWNPIFSSCDGIDVDDDVYFIGEAKNRYSEIVSLKEKCDELNLKSNFQIISSNPLPYTQVERVDYYEVLNHIQKSKALVDIVTKDNWGLTIRPLEALMSKKKLITNFTDIKNYDFYMDNVDNIFIIGENSWDNLVSFIKSPFVEGSGTVYNYDSLSWIKKMMMLVKSKSAK